MSHERKSNLFDTHEFIKGLKERGMPEEQAEFLAKHHLDVLNTHIATKADLYRLRTDLENKVEKSSNRKITTIGVALVFIGLLVVLK